MWRKIANIAVVPLLYMLTASLVALCVANRVALDEERLSFMEPEEEEWIISPYDGMFQEVGEQYAVDWVLLSAIASVESKFDPDAVSKAGAVGLMQVMPSVARRMGCERDSLFNERVNVEVAAQILHENNDMLHFSQKFNKTERLNFILACYNAGYSRIADARRLTRFHDENANKWSVVATYLPLLAEPEYADHEVVRAGAFHGSTETIAYVKKVMRVYKRFKDKITKIEKERAKEDDNS